MQFRGGSGAVLFRWMSWRGGSVRILAEGNDFFTSLPVAHLTFLIHSIIPILFGVSICLSLYLVKTMTSSSTNSATYIYFEFMIGLLRSFIFLISFPFKDVGWKFNYWMLFHCSALPSSKWPTSTTGTWTGRTRATPTLKSSTSGLFHVFFIATSANK